jgi:hypothetical protein
MDTLIDDCLVYIYKSLPPICKITFAIAYKRVDVLCPSCRDVSTMVMGKIDEFGRYMLALGCTIRGDFLLDILYDTNYAKSITFEFALYDEVLYKAVYKHFGGRDGMRGYPILGNDCWYMEKVTNNIVYSACPMDTTPTTNFAKLLM